MKKYIVLLIPGIIIAFVLWQLWDVTALFFLFGASIAIWFAVTIGKRWLILKRITVILILAWVLSVGLFLLLSEVIKYKVPNPLEGHSGQIGVVAFNSSADRLASGGMDRTVRLWNAKEDKYEFNRELPAKDLPFYALYPYNFTGVAYSPDGALVAAASTDWTVRVWKINDKSLSFQLSGHTKDIRVLAFSPDGRFLASGSDDKTVRLWRVIDGSLAMIYTGQNDGVTALAFSPDSNTLAVAGTDKNIRLWQVGNSYSLVKSLSGHSDLVLGVTFTPDGLELLSVTDKRTLRRWKVADGSYREMYRERREAITTAAFSRDTMRFATGDSDKAVRVWSTIEITVTSPIPTITPNVPVTPILPYPPMFESEKLPDVITTLTFDANGKYLVVGNRDKKIRVWSPPAKSVIKTLEQHSGVITGVAFSPDGMMIVSSGEDKTVRLWQFGDGKPVFTFEGVPHRILQIAFNHDSSNVVSADRDGQIRTWGIEKGNLINEHTWGPSLITSLVVNPANGVTVAAGNTEGQVRLFPMLGLLLSFDASPEEISSLAYRPDGKVLASGSIDQPIRLWGPEGKKLHELPVQNGRITSLTFSPDGKTLASASTNKTLTVWKFDSLDVITGTQQINLPPLSASVTTMVFSQDGQVLITCDLEGNVRIWNVVDKRLIEERPGYAQPVLAVGIQNDETIQAVGTAVGRPALQTWTVGNLKDLRNPLSFYYIRKLLLGTEAARFFWSVLFGILIATGLVLLSLWNISGFTARAKLSEFPDINLAQMRRWVFDVELGIHRGQFLASKGGSTTLRPAVGSLSLLGGPGMLIVEEGNAVVLMRSGKVSRIVGAGIIWLLPFERISMVAYLPVQTETIQVKDTLTLDKRILAEFNVLVFHKVDSGDESQTSGQYRFDPKLIQEKIWSPKQTDWLRAVRSISESVVQDAIAGFTLEDIATISGEARQQLAVDLAHRINAKTKDFLGVEVTGTSIGKIRIPEEASKALEEKGNAEVNRQKVVINAEAEREKTAIEAQGIALKIRLVEQERAAIRERVIKQIQDPLISPTGEPLVSEETAQRYITVLVRFLDMFEAVLGPDELDRIFSIRGRTKS